MAGYTLEMAAEVVNLERTVKIHGPDEDFGTTRQGFHMGTFGADAPGEWNKYFYG